MREIQLLCVLSACLFSCNDKTEVEEEGEEEVVEELVFSSGNYKGRWDSSTPTASFSNLGISASLTEVSPGSFQGVLFISSNFTSCCGSANDGAISFTVSEETITDFIWDDNIPNCTGAFAGAGVITSKDHLRIDFTGHDCDGDHVGHLTFYP